MVRAQPPPSDVGSTGQRVLLYASTGAIFGSVIVKLAGSFASVNVEIAFTSASMFVWCFLCGFVRATPAHSYAGVVAAFTAGIILVGFDRTGSLTRDEYVLARIEMTCLGVLVWLVVFHLLSTERASVQMHNLVHEACEGVADAADILKQMLESSDRDKQLELLTQVLQLKQTVSSLVDEALELSAESVSEPQLWHASFATVRVSYERLCESCRKIVAAQANIALSLHEVRSGRAINSTIEIVLGFSSFNRDQRDASVYLGRVAGALGLIAHPGRLPEADVATPGSAPHRMFADTIRGLAPLKPHSARRGKPEPPAATAGPASTARPTPNSSLRGIRDPTGEFVDIREEWRATIGSPEGRKHSKLQRPDHSLSLGQAPTASNKRRASLALTPSPSAGRQGRRASRLADGDSSPLVSSGSPRSCPDQAEAQPPQKPRSPQSPNQVGRSDDKAPVMQNRDVVFASPFIVAHLQLVNEVASVSRETRQLLVTYLISNGVSLEHLPGAQAFDFDLEPPSHGHVHGSDEESTAI